MSVRGNSVLFIMEDGRGVSFVGEEIAQDRFPTCGERGDIGRQRGGIQHVPQIDDGNRKHDHQSGRRFLHKLRSNELRRTCKDNGRHHLRLSRGQPSIQRQRAIDQAEGNPTDQQWDLRSGSRPKLFALFTHKYLFALSGGTVFVSAVVEARITIRIKVFETCPSTRLGEHSLRSGRNYVFCSALPAFHSTFHEALNI